LNHRLLIWRQKRDWLVKRRHWWCHYISLDSLF
jgi:hypothetical protein